MSRRIAVTGATGFIGRHLVAHLSGRGDDVRAIVRPESRRMPPERATVVRAPLESDALEQPFETVDTIVHLAGVVSAIDPVAYENVNVAGTKAVAIAARRAGTRLVHISSLAAAGPAPAASPRSELDSPRPVTAYGKSKLAGERAVMEADGLRWTILRPGVVYGPADRAMLPLFRLVRAGIFPVIGRTDAAYTFGYIDDVVRAIVAAVDSDRDGELMFVGHPRPVTAREIVETIAKTLDRRVLHIPVPNACARLAARAGDVAGRAAGRPMPFNTARYVELSADGFVCRVDRLRDRLGIVAEIDLRVGIARTAEWYRRKEWI